VLSLWEKVGGHDVAGIGRFNEAIDQAIISAVSRFTTVSDHYRDQTLGILGHDLRNPLASIITSAALLGTMTLTEEQRRDIVNRVGRSATRMNRMIEDLLDLTRTRFGDAIPIDRKFVDLGTLCRQVVAEHAGEHGARIELVASGDLRGEWDGDRISQVVSNLVRNAIDHGARDKPITVTVRGRADDVLIESQNYGPRFRRTRSTSSSSP